MSCTERDFATIFVPYLRLNSPQLIPLIESGVARLLGEAGTYTSQSTVLRGMDPFDTEYKYEGLGLGV
jgi:hypothetical protein